MSTLDHRARESIAALDLPPTDRFDLPASDHRFPDGAPFHIEIPSVEGPAALQEVVDAAEQRQLRVHRVSQGSGIMLQADAELDRMIEIGREHAIEVCLFVGPRAGWDIGAQARTTGGSVIGASLRGADQLRFGTIDVFRACERGLRSVLVADVGHLWVLGQLRARGDLPADLILKVSVSLPVANPATAKVIQELGGDTINLPVDLSVPQLAAIRQAIDAPIDLYIEGPDDFGAPVRYHELPEIVRVTAPVHLKFAVRNAAGIYPAGEHLEAHVLATARERVRRASIGLEHLRRAGVEVPTG
jgi:hypothetical protein